MKNPTKFLRNAFYVSMGVYAARLIKNAFTKINLANKVVLITGGSRGLGLVLARQLAEARAKVVICAANEEELAHATQEFAGRNQMVLAVTCDITNKSQVEKMMGEISQKLGTVDILINNAGVIQVGPMENMTDQDYESAMKVHFFGPLYTMNAVIPAMKKARQGNIVNIVSIGGKISVPHLLPYSASKFALAGLSEGFTTELAPYQIKVTTVYPGLTRTGSPRNVNVKGQQDKEFAWFKTADSLPLLAMGAETAAKKIIAAMRTGKTTITLGFPAKLGELMHAIAPGLTLSVLDLVNRLLPEPDPNNNKSVKGYETDPDISLTLTKKTDQAALSNNEVD